MSLQNDIDNAIEELRDWAKDNPGDDPRDAIIYEIADSVVPIYTSTLLEYALDDLYLATEEPESSPAFDGSPTAVNIIAANIYDRLVMALEEAWNEIEQEREDELEEEDSEEDSEDEPITAQDYLGMIIFWLKAALEAELSNSPKVDNFIIYARTNTNEYNTMLEESNHD